MQPDEDFGSYGGDLEISNNLHEAILLPPQKNTDQSSFRHPNSCCGSYFAIA
jgi:hypothetical protein